MSKLPDIEFFEFFIELSSNNNKTWFDANRTRYEEKVKKPFENLVQQLIDAMATNNPDFIDLQAKECIFRINKDIRFSKDKTPYKLNRSAVIAPGGRKDMSGKGFYVEVGPESCGFYTGSYMPEKDQLFAIRNKIAKEPKVWKNIIENRNFAEIFGEVRGNRQSKGDPQFRPFADALPELKNTQFYIYHPIEPELLIEQNPVTYFIDLWKVAEPFTLFVGDKKEISV